MTLATDPHANPLSCAHFIKEIGRGANGARALSPDDTRALFLALLDGRVPDLELGALLLAYRIKGETAAELAAMLQAVHASFAPVRVLEGPVDARGLDDAHGAHEARGSRDARSTHGLCNAHDSHNPRSSHDLHTRYRAVSIPSYNGARRQPNLVPLLARLLAREGVPVLVHGVTAEPGRVTSAEIFAAMGIAPARSHDEIAAQLATRRLAFAPIDVLAPKLARLLALRARMGVRNPAHTLVKLLQPLAQPALRLVNYTHPRYRETLLALFAAHPDVAAGDALLARGTEGEAVADTRRQAQVDWLHDGVCETLIEAGGGLDIGQHAGPKHVADGVLDVSGILPNAASGGVSSAGFEVESELMFSAASSPTSNVTSDAAAGAASEVEFGATSGAASSLASSNATLDAAASAVSNILSSGVALRLSNTPGVSATGAPVSPDAPDDTLPASRDAATTAAWIEAVLRGDAPVPRTIARQVEAIVSVAAT